MGDVGDSQRKTVGCSKVCRRRALFPIAVCLGLATTGAFGQGPAAQAPAATMAAQEAQSPAPPLLLNERHPLPGMLTGGSLAGKDKAPDFQAMAAAGVRTYIDLRTDAEVLPDTALLAAGAGLDYRRLPISGEAELDLASVRALDLLLDEWSRYPVAVACSSGNRAGALLALRAFWLDGVDAASALELGLGAGLTRLEPSVRQLLGLPPMPGASPISPPASTGAPSPAVDAATRMPQKPN